VEVNMRKILIISVMTILMSAFLAVPVMAQEGPPVGTCAPGFVMHHFMEHVDHHDHHIGMEVDLNGDGFICVKHLSNGLHVHVDNVLP
jgi:hypothetical protein